MPIEIRVPSLGESIAEATVSRWMKSPGDAVSAGESLLELETDKVNLEVPADQDGVLESITRQAGESVNVGDVLGLIGVSKNGTSTKPTAAPPTATVEPTPASAPAEPAPVAASTSVTESTAHSAATPLAQALASDKGVDLAKVAGTGAGGKITKQDVESFSTPAKPATPAPPVAAPAVQPAQVSAPSSNGSGNRREERVPMSRRRQTIAARLVEAQHTAAMLTTFNEVDMTAVMEIRKRKKDSFKEKQGVGLGFMSFFTKACIVALKEYPRLNAEIQGTDIVLKTFYDIGMAVSTEEGLVVPVVRDADQKSFAQIEKDIVDVATRARTGKLTLPELMGGTFTITNGGIFGSLLSTPILNTPQVGILGMHKIEERPIALNGQVVIRPMMYLALSYDHRIVDGAEAVRFLVRVKECLEHPEDMLVDG
jgi:2-oxoglutarate dehydrogenase E2 component (dihydrolipoamide succinyltransferase)